MIPVSSATTHGPRPATREAAAGAATAQGRQEVTVEDAALAVDRAAVRYDRQGDQHYDVISAFIKFGENAGFVQVTYSDGTVTYTATNGASLGVTGGVGGKMDIGELEPSGSGRAELRLEGETIELSRLRYFNRGTEIRAMATIDDVWRLPQSPITGTAVARGAFDVTIRASNVDGRADLRFDTAVAVAGVTRSWRM